jgi:ketosteroid isomerase-like protein
MNIHQVLDDWTEAERDTDAQRLAPLLTDDFVGIGPVGFVLAKAAWLSRFDQGLHYEALTLDEITPRDYGDAIAVVARQYATGDHQGMPTPADTRVGFIVVRIDVDLRIAGIQYSFNGVPGAPPPRDDPTA